MPTNEQLIEFLRDELRSGVKELRSEMHAGFGQMNAKLDQTNGKLGGLNANFDLTNPKLGGLKDRIDLVDDRIDQMNTKVDQTNATLRSFKKEVLNRFDGVTALFLASEANFLRLEKRIMRSEDR